MLQAMSMGEIHLRSHLNDPLQATIPLNDVNKTRIEDIIVTSADPSAYEELGLEVPSWVASVQFKIKIDPKTSKPVIDLKTQQPIKDPFADLMIQVKTPEGSIVREYTLLFDPRKAQIKSTSETILEAIAPAPTTHKVIEVAQAPKASEFVAAQEEPVIDANNTEQFVVVEPPPEPVKITAAEEPPTFTSVETQSNETVVVKNSNVAEGRTYRPRREETLWSIAKRYVQNTPFSIHQGVDIIARNNAHAFRKGNINAMVEGTTLILPALENADHIQVAKAHKPARKPVTQQVAQKSDYQRKLLTLEGFETESKPVHLASLDTKGLLEGVDPAQKRIALQQLSVMEEAIDTLKRSNEDILARNHQLQEQYEKLASQIGLRDESASSSFAVASISNEAHAPRETIAMAVNAAVEGSDEVALTKPPMTTKLKYLMKENANNVILGLAFAMFTFMLGLIAFLRKWFKRTPEIYFSNDEITITAPFQANVKKEPVVKYAEPLMCLPPPTPEIEEVDTYIAYERYTQAEKILNRMLVEDKDYGLPLLKLFELYLITERYREFEQLYVAIPKHFASITPEVKARVEILRRKVLIEKAL